eukprot:gene5878-4198_t
MRNKLLSSLFTSTSSKAGPTPPPHAPATPSSSTAAAADADALLPLSYRAEYSPSPSPSIPAADEAAVAPPPEPEPEPVPEAAPYYGTGPFFFERTVALLNDSTSAEEDPTHHVTCFCVGTGAPYQIVVGTNRGEVLAWSAHPKDTQSSGLPSPEGQARRRWTLLETHGSPVTAVGVAGEIVASADQGGVVRVRHTRRGEQRWSYTFADGGSANSDRSSSTLTTGNAKKSSFRRHGASPEATGSPTTAAGSSSSASFHSAVTYGITTLAPHPLFDGSPCYPLACVRKGQLVFMAATLSRQRHTGATRQLILVGDAALRKSSGPVLQVRWRPGEERGSCLAWLTPEEAVVFHYSSRRALRAVPHPATHSLQPANTAGTTPTTPSPSPARPSTSSLPSAFQLWRAPSTSTPSRSEGPTCTRTGAGAGAEGLAGCPPPRTALVTPPFLFSLEWEADGSALLLNWGQWLQEVLVTDIPTAAGPSGSAQLLQDERALLSGGRAADPITPTTTRPGRGGTATAPAPPPSAGAALPSSGSGGAGSGVMESFLNAITRTAEEPMLKVAVRPPRSFAAVQEGSGVHMAAVAPYGACRYVVLTLAPLPSSPSPDSHLSLSGETKAAGKHPPVREEQRPPVMMETAGQVRLYVVERDTLSVVYSAHLDVCVALPYQLGFACALAPLNAPPLPRIGETGVGVPMEFSSVRGTIPPAEPVTKSSPFMEMPRQQPTDDSDTGEEVPLQSVSIPSPGASTWALTHASVGSGVPQITRAGRYMQTHYPPEGTCYAIRVLDAVLQLKPPSMIDKVRHLLYDLHPDTETTEPEVHPLTYLVEGFWLAVSQRRTFTAYPERRTAALEAIQRMIDVSSRSCNHSLPSPSTNPSDRDTSPLCHACDRLWAAATEHITYWVELVDVAADQWEAWLSAYDEANQVWRLVGVLPDERHARLYTMRGTPNHGLPAEMEEKKQDKEAETGDLPNESCESDTAIAMPPSQTSSFQVDEAVLPASYYEYLVLCCLEKHRMHLRRAIRCYSTVVDVDLLQQAIGETIIRETQEPESLQRAEDECAHARRRELLDAYSDVLLLQQRPDEALHVMLQNPRSTALFPYVATQPPGPLVRDFARELWVNNPTQTLEWLVASTAAQPQHKSSTTLLSAKDVASALLPQDRSLLWAYVAALPQQDRAEVAAGLVQHRPLLYAQLCLCYGTQEDVLQFLRTYETPLRDHCAALHALCETAAEPLIEARALLLARLGREVEGLALLVSELRSMQCALEYVHGLPPLRPAGAETLVSDREREEREEERRSSLFRWLVDEAVAAHRQQPPPTARASRSGSTEGSQRVAPRGTVLHYATPGDTYETVAARYRCATAADVRDATAADTYYRRLVTTAAPPPSRVQEEEGVSPTGFYVVPSSILTALLVALSLCGGGGKRPPHRAPMSAEGAMRASTAADLQYLLSRLPDFHSIDGIGQHLEALAAYWAQEERFHTAATRVFRDDVKASYTQLLRGRTGAVRVDPASTSCPVCLLPICTERTGVVAFCCGHIFHSACAASASRADIIRRRQERRAAVSRWYGVPLPVPPASSHFVPLEDMGSCEEEEEVEEGEASGMASVKREARGDMHLYCSVCQHRKYDVTGFRREETNRRRMKGDKHYLPPLLFFFFYFGCIKPHLSPVVVVVVSRDP